MQEPQCQVRRKMKKRQVNGTKVVTRGIDTTTNIPYWVRFHGIRTDLFLQVMNLISIKGSILRPQNLELRLWLLCPYNAVLYNHCHLWKYRHILAC